MKRTPKAANIAHAEEVIAEAAGSYPEVVEEGPWGHRAFKVKKKSFLFMVADAEGLSFSVKLPASGKAALSLGFTSPTEYGLGKSGWVTARFGPKDSIPLDTIRGWVDESFRAMAPAKLVRSLDESVGPKSAPSRTKARSTAGVPKRSDGGASRKSVKKRAASKRKKSAKK